MIADLAVLVPSRGRAGRLAVMLDATLSLSQTRPLVVVATDDDDPQIPAYETLLMPLVRAKRVHWVSGQRRSLTGWTNLLASWYMAECRALASFGDDHVPVTAGWDTGLLGALGMLGGTGIVYPDDRRRTDIPEAAVISADIVTALGWMCQPSLSHFYVDNVWADLGRGAGCLAYVPGVVVEHLHYSRCRDVTRDATYAEAETGGTRDRIAYEQWRASSMTADIATICALREGAAQQAGAAAND